MKSGLSNLYYVQPPIVLEYKTSGRDSANYPKRSNRWSHADYLKKNFAEVWIAAEKMHEQMKVASFATRNGIYLEVKGQKGYDLLTKSLEDVRQHVRIRNIKTEGDEPGESVTCSTVFIPSNKRDFFINKINKYRETDNEEKVISTINSFNLAMVDALWTSDKSKMPEANPSWCEVWLAYDPKEQPDDVISEFFCICEELDIAYKNQRIIFPERIVLGVHANKQQLSDLQWKNLRVAEIRIMITPTGFYDSLSESEQRGFVDDFLERTDISKQSNTSVCLLDTGVNNGHGLLVPLIKDEYMHTVDPNKGVHDKADHGTRMAGIASYFTLEEKMEGREPIIVNHFLESVKLFDKRNDNPQELYGYITESAIYLAEIQNPDTNRAICMAVTAENNTIKNDGRPSSWSGAIDAIIAGVNQTGSSAIPRRLMFISAGNTTINEIKDSGDAKTAVINHLIGDPAQAWNTITVGAYTDKFKIPDNLSGTYRPVVEPGCFSPFTSSSLMWAGKWPIKPDIVLEGGNLAFDRESNYYSEFPDMQLLTTSKNFAIGKPLDTISMTSAATAQAAWIGANIMHFYPDYWPETIRALIIHSSSWTEVMKKELFESKPPKRSDYRRLLRTCGYGIPDLEKAIWCASNRVNLIIEDEIQPFYKKENGSITAKEMHVHKIPWPNDVLLGLDDEKVRMRVTLSYFIEPGPGEIGWKDKYRYPSCGLQFDVNNPMEDYDNFVKRINLAAREDKDDKGNVKNISSRWIIGIENRNVGSIHSDIWEGTASELSESNKIAIYPITGWWKLRTNLKKYNSKVKYSLIVSIESPESEIDLYTIIKNKIDVAVSTSNRAKMETEVTVKRKSVHA